MNTDKTHYTSLGLATTNAFVSELVQKLTPNKILHLNPSNFDLFQGIQKYGVLKVDASEKIPEKGIYDFIVGDMPLGMGSKRWKSRTTDIEITTQMNWIEILESLFHLSDQGIGLFLVEPHGLRSKAGEKFTALLNGQGFYVQGIFNTPPEILAPSSSIQPCLLLISRKERERLFIAELSSPDQAEKVIHNFTNDRNENNLMGGLFIDHEEFKSFYQYRISKQIEKLETQYKEYDTYELNDVALEVNSVKSGAKFTERENAIYVPKIGNSAVVANLEYAKLKHHNYYQIVLNAKIVKKEYLALYFSSTVGRLVLASLSSQTFIPHVNLSGLNEANIAVPKLQEQEIIIETYEKLTGLKTSIDEFEKELALNPTSSLEIQEQLDLMLESIGKLSDADRVRAIIREGETRTIEFKQTLSLDIRTQKKEKRIELSALKTVVAFLNTKGGNLLIGVDDEGVIQGVEEEIAKFYPGSDKYLLHFKNLLKNRIGEEFYDFIDYHFVNMDKKKVLFVDCKGAKRPCFLDETEFYVRANPATDRLEGRKLAEYLENHFKKE